jgi:hypothetical protein
LSRILWLQGFPEQAMRTAERCIDDARAANHAVSLCNALALGTCLIALLVGDLAKAERYIGILLDHSKKSALPVSHAYGRSYDGVLAIERGDLDSGLRLLRAGLDDFEEMTPRRYPTRPVFPAQLARALAGVGRIADGLAAIDEVLAWTVDTEADWFIAELLRVKASFFCCGAHPKRRRRLRITSGRRSTGHAGKARCPGNCAQPRASPACGAIRAAPPTPPPASSRSTIASRRVSGRLILSRRNDYWMTSALLDTAEVCSPY